MNLRLVVAGLGFGLCAGIGPAQADVGAVGGPTLCSVAGVVKSVMQEEMAATGKSAHVMVPVVVLEVSAVTPVDAAYKGDFCSHITTVPAGGKATGYYRLCDAAAEFMTAQTIHGVVGLSQGGGRLCLAQIQVQH